MKIIINGEVVEVGGSDGVPVKPMTKAAYDALTEEEKRSEAVYLVDEPAWTPVSLSIQEYDTEDGWHVRKYSDGYMEQTLKRVISGINVTNSWGNGYNSGVSYGPFLYPEPFSELYWVDISSVGSVSIIPNYNFSSDVSPLTNTHEIGIFRPTPNSNVTLCIYVFAKGRWK